MPKPLKNWKEMLDGIEYDSTPDERGSSGVRALVSNEELTHALVYALLLMARRLTCEKEYDLVGYEALRVWSALLYHVQAKCLYGATYDSAERADREFAWNMLPQVKTKVKAIPGLIVGIAEDRDCLLGPGIFDEDRDLTAEEERITAIDMEGCFMPTVHPIHVKFDLDPDDLETLRSIFTDEGEPLPIIPLQRGGTSR